MEIIFCTKLKVMYLISNQKKNNLNETSRKIRLYSSLSFQFIMTCEKKKKCILLFLRPSCCFVCTTFCLFSTHFLLFFKEREEKKLKRDIIPTLMSNTKYTHFWFKRKSILIDIKCETKIGSQ